MIPIRGPLPVQAEADEVRRTLAEVLDRPEFGQEESWFLRLLERFFSWFDLPSAGPGRVALVLVAAVVAVFLGLVVARLLRDVSARRRDVDTPHAARARSAEDVHRRVSELLREARGARERGDLVLALRLFFFALVVGLGRRGELAYRDAWTNRELLERGEPSTDARRVLAPLVAELDRKGFGREPTGPEDVARLEQLCGRLLGGPSKIGGVS